MLDETYVIRATGIAGSDLASYFNKSGGLKILNYYDKPLAIRKAIIHILSGRELKSLKSNLAYFCYKWLAPMALLRILRPVRIVVPKFQHPFEEEYFSVSKGVRRGKPPCIFGVVKDVPIESVWVFPIFRVISVVRLAMKSGLFEPYYHLVFLACADRLKASVFAGKTFVWEDGGDALVQVLVSLRYRFKNIIGFYSTPMAYYRTYDFVVATNRDAVFSSLKAIGQQTQLLNYKLEIYSDFDDEGISEFYYTVGMIFPLSHLNTFAFGEMLRLLSQLGRQPNVSILASFHPQERSQPNIQGLGDVRDRNKCSDLNFASCCDYFVCASSSLTWAVIDLNEESRVFVFEPDGVEIASAFSPHLVYEDADTLMLCLSNKINCGLQVSKGGKHSR